MTYRIAYKAPVYVRGNDRFNCDMFVRMSLIQSFRRYEDHLNHRWVVETKMKDGTAEFLYSITEDESKEIVMFILNRGLTNV